jgi:hypothetical protein
MRSATSPLVATGNENTKIIVSPAELPIETFDNLDYSMGFSRHLKCDLNIV